MLRKILLAAVSIGLMGASAHAATVTLVNINGPGFGLNDPTPVAPVGGNPGTTLGAQRMFALQFAANEWASHLESDVEIRIEVGFASLPCNQTGAVLASTSPFEVFSDFPNAALPATWYHKALADSISGEDLDPTSDDLFSIFNASIDTGCFGIPFYYGVDNGAGSAALDIVSTSMHEFGHGLGFSTFVDSSDGTELAGQHDIYEHNIFDLSAKKGWEAMTDDERAASAINTRKVVWSGKNVTKAVPRNLDPGTPTLAVLFPLRTAALYDVGPAQFGPPLSNRPVTSLLANATPADGCAPLTNRFGVLGRIAIIDRGTCAFTQKVQNAQAAGAVGVIIVDNLPGTPPPGLAGSDPTGAIHIPSVRVSQDAGAKLRAGLTIFSIGTLFADPLQRQGASLTGQALLWTPNPIQGGSTISHWDVIAFPNLLMEPDLNFDLQHMFDLTLPLLKDEGWKLH